MLSQAMIKKLHRLKELLPQIEEFNQQCELIENDFCAFLRSKLNCYNHDSGDRTDALLECQAIFAAWYKKRLADLMLQYYDLVDSDDAVRKEE